MLTVGRIYSITSVGHACLCFFNCRVFRCRQRRNCVLSKDCLRQRWIRSRKWQSSCRGRVYTAVVCSCEVVTLLWDKRNVYWYSVVVVVVIIIIIVIIIICLSNYIRHFMLLLLSWHFQIITFIVTGAHNHFQPSDSVEHILWHQCLIGLQMQIYTNVIVCCNSVILL